MWQTLKRAFRTKIQRVPRIEPIRFQDGLLAFRATESLQLDRMVVLTPGYTKDVELEIEIVSFEPDSALYRGLVNSEVYIPGALKADRRRESRFHHRLKVTSSVIPGYETRTEDISLNGARISLRQKVQKGASGTLTLYLDDPELSNLSLKFEYRWCAEKRDGSYHAGIHFSSASASDQRIIKRFLEKQDRH